MSPSIRASESLLRAASKAVFKPAVESVAFLNSSLQASFSLNFLNDQVENIRPEAMKVDFLFHSRFAAIFTKFSTEDESGQSYQLNEQSFERM